MVSAAKMQALDRVAAEEVWRWLADVADPEIPVLSVIDLGIVRDVAWQETGGVAECVVTITPTYSGCPATDMIAQAIEVTLKAHGVERVRLETRLSPAWTTDWISEEGRRKLEGYGIAPPAQQAIDIGGITRGAHGPAVPCPRCGSLHTRLISQFGSTSCKALYRCNDCLEPFDYFKSH